jgi:hypothetical protein
MKPAVTVNDWPTGVSPLRFTAATRTKASRLRHELRGYGERSRQAAWATARLHRRRPNHRRRFAAAVRGAGDAVRPFGVSMPDNPHWVRLRGRQRFRRAGLVHCGHRICLARLLPPFYRLVRPTGCDSRAPAAGQERRRPCCTRQSRTARPTSRPVCGSQGHPCVISSQVFGESVRPLRRRTLWYSIPGRSSRGE